MLSRKTQPEKKGEQVFSRSPTFVYSPTQRHSESLAGLWPVLASTLTTKGLTGHDSITLGCLTPFRFPHLPVKISFYRGGCFHSDKHKEKGVREREQKRISTYSLLSAKVLNTHRFTSFSQQLVSRPNPPQSTAEEKETELQVFPNHHLKMANLDNETPAAALFSWLRYRTHSFDSGTQVPSSSDQETLEHSH